MRAEGEQSVRYKFSLASCLLQHKSQSLSHGLHSLHVLLASCPPSPPCALCPTHIVSVFLFYAVYKVPPVQQLKATPVEELRAELMCYPAAFSPEVRLSLELIPEMHRIQLLVDIGLWAPHLCPHWFQLGTTPTQSLQRPCTPCLRAPSVFSKGTSDPSLASDSSTSATSQGECCPSGLPC